MDRHFQELWLLKSTYNFVVLKTCMKFMTNFWTVPVTFEQFQCNNMDAILSFEQLITVELQWLEH